MLLPCWWGNCWEAAGCSENLEPPLWGQGTSLGSFPSLLECLARTTWPFMGPGWGWAKAASPCPLGACLHSPQPLGRGREGEWEEQGRAVSHPALESLLHWLFEFSQELSNQLRILPPHGVVTCFW